MSQKKALRIKLTTSDGNIGILILVLSTEARKIIETLSLGGAHPELQRIDLADGYKDNRDRLLDARFYSKYNPQVSGDLERYLQKISRNLEFIDRLYDALEKNRKNDLSFLFVNELIVVLGDREIQFDHVYEDIASAEEESEDLEADDVQIDPEGDPASTDGELPNPAAFIPLSFSLAPIDGTQLHDLKEGDTAMVRVKDKEHPLGEAFLSMQAALQTDDNANAPDEYVATLKEIRQNPAGGVFALLSMPDGSDGLVVEEEPGVRVKRPAAVADIPTPEEMVDEKVAMKGMHAEPLDGMSSSPRPARPARPSGPREEVPMPVILGFAAVAVALSLLLLMLL